MILFSAGADPAPFISSLSRFTCTQWFIFGIVPSLFSLLLIAQLSAFYLFLLHFPSFLSRSLLDPVTVTDAQHEVAEGAIYVLTSALKKSSSYSFFELSKKASYLQGGVIWSIHQVDSGAPLENSMFNRWKEEERRGKMAKLENSKFETCIALES